MKVVEISKYVVVTYALITSPLIGIGFLGYILYVNRRIKILELQLESKIAESKDNNEDKNILNSNLEDAIVKETATNFEEYKNCVVENYQNKFYRVLKPDREYLPKIFLSIDDAKQEIDMFALFLDKPEYKKNRIYNIRYVK